MKNSVLLLFLGTFAFLGARPYTGLEHSILSITLFHTAFYTTATICCVAHTAFLWLVYDAQAVEAGHFIVI